MTRKHFEQIAAALRDTKPPKPGADKSHYWAARYASEVKRWEIVVERMTEFCAESNPRFDRERFQRACGLEDEPITKGPQHREIRGLE